MVVNSGRRPQLEGQKPVRVSSHTGDLVLQLSSYLLRNPYL
jgi:hypothetical protein